MMRKRKGQSTMEYVLLFAGLTLAILYAVNNVVIGKARNQANVAGNIIANVTTELSTAVGLSKNKTDVILTNTTNNVVP